MSLRIRKNLPREWKNPREGLHQAELISVEDLGERTSPYGTKEAVRLRHQLLDEQNDASQPLTVSTICTSSLHEKSSLYQHVRALLGHVPDEVTLSDLVGRRCQVILANREDAKGRVWSNITTVLPPPKDEPAPQPKNFSTFASLTEDSPRPAPSERVRLMRERFAAQREVQCR
jgi:hypothetical protein